MQSTSEIWKTLAVADGTYVEAKAIINGVEYTDIEPPVITRALMQNGLEVGNVVSAMCSLTLDANETIPKSADARIFARLSGGKAANVTVDITPVQSGSGDPSPTNVRPISGWTGAKVTRAGKNLLPNNATSTIQNGVTFTVNTDGTVKAVGTATAQVTLFLVGTNWGYNNTYKNLLKKGNSYIMSGGQNNNIRVELSVYNSDGTLAIRTPYTGNDGTATFSIPNDASDNLGYLGYIRINSGFTVDFTFKPMIRLASDADPTFAPYTGTTLSITFPSEAGTVYGGTLDVTTGLLTVTMAEVDLGTLTWAKAGTGPNGYATDSLKNTQSVNPVAKGFDWITGVCNVIVSNGYKPDTGSNVYLGKTDNTIGVDPVGRVYIYDSSKTSMTVEQFKAAMSGVQLVYELATPQTYQLTPTQITLLAGENNIWADCGDVAWYVSDEPLHSEWLPQGLFYISKRIRDPNTNIQHFECYDTLLRSNVIWTPASSTWPQETEDILDEILAAIGLQLDPRTSIVSYPISEPIPGTTMRDILSLIAQHNGGNWIVTPENKLRLVPIVDLGGAEEADTIVDVDAVVGSYYVGETKTISGIRFPVDDATSIVGDETGAVVTVSIPGVIVADLAETLIGKSYKPFMFGTAYYDMAAELGDYVQADDIISVLYAETITLGAVMHGDIAAPDIAEIDDEYPYVSNSQKTVALAKAAVNEAIEQFDDDLTQQEIFNRLTDNGAAQGLVLYNGQLYVNASYINAGYLSANRIHGGSLRLGGLNNVNGELFVLDNNGNLAGHWTNQGLHIPFENGSLSLGADPSSPIYTTYTYNGETYSYLLLGDKMRIESDDNIAEISPKLFTFYVKGTEYPSIVMWGDSGKSLVLSTIEGSPRIELQGGGGGANTTYITDDEIDTNTITAQRITLRTPLGIEGGGTGANNAAAARSNLGITPANIGAVSKAGDTMTGPLTVTGADIIQSDGYIKGSIEDYPYHAIKLGHIGDNVLQFLEFGGQFDFYKTFNGTNTLLFQVKDGVSAKPLPVNNGGTGATSESGARSNLKVPYSPGSTTVSSFSQIPTEAGFYMVQYTGTDPDAPSTTSAARWWNVIQIGVASRLVQIANNAFSYRNQVFIRVKHDSTWHGWYKFEGTQV